MQHTISKKNNFDLLRLLFSITVFLVHSPVLSKKAELAFITKYLSSAVAVNSFFVISGFLVTMSFYSSSSKTDYFIKRARRIYPAYTAVILISAVAGLLLTTLPFTSYFSFDLLKYLFANLSFLNLLQPALPGVFDSNSMSSVNGALWSIRFEVLFYTIIPLTVLFSRKYNKKYFCLLSISTILFFKYISQVIAVKISSAPFALLLNLAPEIFLYFICGSFLYIFHKDFKKWAHLLFTVAFTGYFVAKLSGFNFLMPFFISFIVIYFACEFKFLGNWGKYGDFSYGIYIWHFPILQTMISLGLFDKTPYIALALSTLIILGFAWLSWHFIEKRFLKRSSHYILSTIQK